MTNNLTVTTDVTPSIKPGDHFQFDAMKAFTDDKDTHPILVDVDVISVDDNYIYCTIANHPRTIPIKRDVFMRVIAAQ